MQKLWITIALVIISLTAYTQRGFTAEAVLGANVSQIDGDALYGFDKLGVTGGAKIGYNLDGRWKAHLEMLYSQRGSNSNFGIGSTNANHIHTEYIELPILASIHDWYMPDEGYYKASIHTGLSTGYLIKVRSNITEYDADIDNYNRMEVSFVLGGSFRLSKSFGLTLRYTRGINSLRKTKQSTGSTKGIQYFWTIRSEYKF